MLQINVLEIQSLRVGVARGREAFGSFLCALDPAQDMPFEVGSDMRRGGEGAFLFVGGVGCVL